MYREKERERERERGMCIYRKMHYTRAPSRSYAAAETKETMHSKHINGIELRNQLLLAINEWETLELS